MIVRKSKEKTIKKFRNGNLDNIEVIIPNISDHVMNYADANLKLDRLIEENVEYKTHEDGMPSSLFIYGLLSAKLKRLFSVSSSILAITTLPIIEKFNLNIASKDEFTCESNMRKFINKIGTSKEITKEQLEEKIKEIKEKNKTIKKDKDKTIINETKIREELQIKQNGHQFVKLFNKITKELINITEKPRIHILDCVKMPVNIKNENYELSSVINYEGTPMRGYKMGVLRGITSTGAIIEHLIDDTISTNDLKLVENEIVNYNNFQNGDYLLMDRGFAKIDFVINLVNQGINVIVPAKKNMDIYNECVKLAKENNDDWKKHPNPKRKGQEIKLITNLKGLWITESDKFKKPEKVFENALDFNACVIRIDKSIKKNKEIIDAVKKSSDETDELYEDHNFIYLVILSTNTKLNATEIVRYYEMRPEIEEDFRQLKDIWKICTFTSTKYTFVMCQICMTFLAYNLFNLFKTSKKGTKYINKSIKIISQAEQRDRIPFYEINYLVLTGGYYYIFNGVDFLDLYSECPQEIREKVKPLLT